MIKDKPQTIKVVIHSEFFKIYLSHLTKAIQRKFNISIGIEDDLFTKEKGGTSEIMIRFLANDTDASNILNYITEKWEFLETPVFV
ncbi:MULTISPECIES: hypothetical protein [unclassified Enterococcus]|jgi:hypothetical protein|uniref:hypothetical protein n=1 Tax=unclassified Enterococcus TaxID=2608891 RepID=UPI003D290959